VTLSFVVAVCVSYTALTLASRVATARRGYVRMWLAGGTRYGRRHLVDALHRHACLFAADPALLRRAEDAGFAGRRDSRRRLHVASQKQSSLDRLAGAAMLMGLGIAAMHYSGMFASQFAPGSYCIGATSDNTGWLALVIDLDRFKASSAARQSSRRISRK